MPLSPSQELARGGACSSALTIPHGQVGHGDLPEECRFLLNTQLMFLKKEKDPTTKQFDDDKWIRSLAEAQEVTTDIPEGSVTYDQQDVDPKKSFGPFRWESSCGSTSRGDPLALSEGEIAAFTTSMRQIGVGTPGGAEALAMFHQLFFDEWMTGSPREWPLARINVDEKLFWVDRMEGCARGGVAVPPQAHGSRSVETSKLVSC